MKVSAIARLATLTSFVALTACAGEVAEAPGVAEHDVVEQAAPASAYASVCSGTGALDIALSASGLDDHEGRAVWMSAVEPGSTDGAATAPVVAFQESVVADGAFALACNAGLTENFAYPSFTVVIDADGSGDCSPGDVAATFQGYGWADHQVWDLTADQDEWSPAQWSEVTAEASTWGSAFCAYYFDDVAVAGG